VRAREVHLAARLFYTFGRGVHAHAAQSLQGILESFSSQTGYDHVDSFSASPMAHGLELK